MLVCDSLSGKVFYYTIKYNTAKTVVSYARNVTAVRRNQCVAEVRLYVSCVLYGSILNCRPLYLYHRDHDSTTVGTRTQIKCLYTICIIIYLP